jgi:hypothetical protein
LEQGAEIVTGEDVIRSCAPAWLDGWSEGGGQQKGSIGMLGVICEAEQPDLGRRPKKVKIRVLSRKGEVPAEMVFWAERPAELGGNGEVLILWNVYKSVCLEV